MQASATADQQAAAVAAARSAASKPPRRRLTTAQANLSNPGIREFQVGSRAQADRPAAGGDRERERSRAAGAIRSWTKPRRIATT